MASRGELYWNWRKIDSRRVQRIKDNFEKAGIRAEVDSGTGDVILDFGKGTTLTPTVTD